MASRSERWRRAWREEVARYHLSKAEVMGVIVPLVVAIAAQFVLVAVSATVYPEGRDRVERIVIETSALTVAKVTAEPKPSVEEIKEMFEAWGNYYGANPRLLAHIAYCESGYNPYARNRIYGGMFQFNVTTWAAERERMGLDPNPALRYNAEEAVKTAAHKLASGDVNAWPYCGRSFFNRI